MDDGCGVPGQGEGWTMSKLVGEKVRMRIWFNEGDRYGDDLLYKAFLKLFRARDTFDEQREVEPWLLRIAGRGLRRPASVG